MSKPVFEDLFNFSCRRNRQSYILLQLASLVALTVLTIVGAIIGEFGVVLAVVGALALVVINWAAASQRIRDFGHSGVWSLVILIPYVGAVASLALWFVPSSEGENKYGPSCI